MRRLLIRPGAIGDCILSLPALECLRSDYTEVWVRSEVAPLVLFADCVRSIASTGLDRMGLDGVDPPPELVARLQSFDSIVSWYGANREEFRTQMSQFGVPIRLLDALPPASEKIHAADFFLKQAGCSGVAIPRISCQPAPRVDFAVIHPFSGSLRKNWALERYRVLARRLEMPVRWCAGPEEQLDDAVRIDNLLELASWLSTARLYIGNDSGITHLAAAVGVPVLAIFGPTDPALWAPRGDRVRVVSGNLDDISTEQVLNTVRSLTV